MADQKFADDFVPLGPVKKPGGRSGASKEFADDFVPLMESPGRGGALGPKLANSTDSTPFTKDNILEFARPLVSDAVKVGGTALAAPTGAFAPAIGYGAAGLVDTFLQKLENKPPRGLISQHADLEPGGIASSLTNTGEMLGLNKLFQLGTDKLFRGGTGLVREGLQGVSIADPKLQRLEATFSQYYDPNTFLGRTAKWAEDTFANVSKGKAVVNSNNLAQEQLQRNVARVAGRSYNTVGNPQVHSQLLQQEAIANQKELQSALKQFVTEANYYKPKFQEFGADGLPASTTNPAVRKVQINSNANPVKYGRAVQNAKGVQDLHDSLFDERGLAGLVADPNNSAISAIDNIINDSQQLERALKSANLPIPGTKGVTSPQLRKDLQGYYINKLIQDAGERDATTGKLKDFSADKLWKSFTDPNKTESMKLLFDNAQQRADLTQFFKNIARVDEKAKAGFITGSKILNVGGSIALASSLLGSGLSGHTAGLVGLKLGGGAIAKLMTNPKTARLMVAIGQGVPLGTSQQYVSRTLADALNGLTVTAISKDDREIRGRFEDGKFEPF